MRRYASFILLLLFLSACATSKESTRFMPDDVDQKVSFGMTLNEFKTLKGDAADMAADDGFRKVYLEEVDGENISAVVYYFDTDGEFPLYEIIVIYNTEEKRDSVAKSMFGEPNHEGKEWRVSTEPYNIWAWTHQKKLVITAMLTEVETEWTDQNW